MSADKRSVSTDALATLGTIIDDTAGRDAIHLAVEPIIAAEKLYPGQDIGIVEGKATTKTDKKLGIVDPFIKDFVPQGERFWLIVYPRQITSLRHVWSHPDFEEKTGKSQIEISEDWLKAYADSIDVSYHELMQTADSHQGDGYGDYIIQGGRFEGEYTPDEFWNHYAVVRNNPNPKRESFFSCSC